MTREELLDLLKAVQKGIVAPEQAIERIAIAPISELGFATVDLHRGIRQGFPEVIYGEGKSAEQILKIAKEIIKHERRVLITRVHLTAAQLIIKEIPQAVYHEIARCIVIDPQPIKKRPGYIAVVAAGTSDLPVAEEAAITADIMGNHVERIYDVGVAGLHRLFSKIELIRNANVIIVVAGMEGALPSVIAGLVSKPLIAVPTSIGYGASLGGIAALLGMLNSCGSGVVVVNIDNGFGAGFAASQINALAAGEK